MTFEEYWMDCNHAPNHYAEISVAFKAGAASRDAEVVSLTNQRDYEYVRAENAEQERAQFEQERDQLREQVKMLRDIVRIAIERGDLYISDQEQAEAVLAATEK